MTKSKSETEGKKRTVKQENTCSLVMFVFPNKVRISEDRKSTLFGRHLALQFNQWCKKYEMKTF